MKWFNTLSHNRWLEQETDRIFDFGKNSVVPTGFGWLGNKGQIKEEMGTHLWITARMLHVYSVAAAMGRPGAYSLVDHGIKAMNGALRDKKYGGWYACVNDEGVRETGRPRCVCWEAGRPCCVWRQAFREGCHLIGRLRHRHRFSRRFMASRKSKCQSFRRMRHILTSRRSVLSHSPEYLASDSKSLAMRRTAMLDHASCVVPRDCFEMRNALDRKSCRAAADSI